MEQFKETRDRMLHIPKDFELLTEYRALKRLTGTAARATHWFVRLWCELAYAAAADGCGVLGRNAAAQLTESLADDPVPDVNPIAALTDCGLLTARDDVWFCNRFKQLHAHLEPGHRPFHVVGADVKTVNGRNRRAAEEVQQQSLLLVPGQIKRPDGEPMTLDERTQAMLYIRWVDNALFRAARDTHEFTEGLMQAAYRLGLEWNKEQLAFACRELAKNRTHHLVAGRPTETVLPELPRLIAAIGSH